MNKTLVRLKELEEQIKKVESIIKNGDYLAEGFKLFFTVGQREEGIQIEIGCYSKIDEEFIKLILQGLKNTKDQYRKHAEEECQELATYLNNHI